MIGDRAYAIAVTASEDSVLLSLARSPFPEAVTGSVESTTVVEDVVGYRMGFQR